MKKSTLAATLFGLIAMAGLSVAKDGTENFDSTAAGKLPTDWIAGDTGFGSPKWAVSADPSALSKPNVLLQSGSGRYPWAVNKRIRMTDGFVETRFKAISGKTDSAAGVVWRWADGNTYYVARANANENNVALYYTTWGIRSTIKYVDAPVARNEWQTLRVEFQGTRIRVILNSKTVIELDDDHINKPGTVGVWTKEDSVTAFDNFSWGEQ